MRYPVAKPMLGRAEAAAVSKCVRDGWISSLSPSIAEFERGFSDFCGTRHGVAMSTGTAALHLALVALGIGPGDEVIVPDMTFVATANAVAYTGATVVPVDIDRATWNVSAERVAERVTRRTRAIIPVHLFGFPADMDALRRIAGSKIALIEDAAEAHGATLHGRRAGNLGDMGCFSFYANKTITTGEGGMITLNDEKIAARLRFLRDHAMDPSQRYYHPELGYNYRLTGLQASIGVAQMRRMDSILRRKKRNAECYRTALSDIPGIEFQMPIPGAVSSEWMFSVLLPSSCDRRRVAEALRTRGIDTRPLFYPISALPMYRAGGTPASREIHRRGLTLPSYAGLTAADIGCIRDTLARVLARMARRARR